jgi:hypothetical protein
MIMKRLTSALFLVITFTLTIIAQELPQYVYNEYQGWQYAGNDITPAMFSRGAALSPAVYFTPEENKEMIRTADIAPDTVLYVDYGEKELFDSPAEELFRETVSLLQEKRILLESRIVPGGIHSEITWEKQVPFFVNALFYEL